MAMPVSETRIIIGKKLSEGPRSNKLFIVYVLNATDWIVTGLLYGHAYVPITPFGRTCAGTVDACLANGDYVPVRAALCSEPAYDLTLQLKNPSDGSIHLSEPVTITPDCNKPGVVFVLDDPIPVV